jgi:hypothetical protein
MATQNLVQYLESTQYSAYPGGSSSSVGVSAMNRRQVETFIASEAIAANDLVSLDLSKTGDGDKALYIVKADSGTATDSCAIGFALNAATAAGQTVAVTIAGIHVSANVASATVAGSRLIVGATAGEAAVAPDISEGGSATVAQYPLIAIAAESDTTNVATVFVIKQF